MRSGMSGRWLLAVAAAVAAVSIPALGAELKVGQPAPAFTAETVDGKKIALADYKGKSAVLLNFYANT